MSDEQTTTPATPAEPQATKEPQEARPGTGESWQEVGRQFQALGQSLATALRMTWQDEEARGRMQAMQSGLESMVRDVGQAIKEPAASPEVEKARAGVAGVARAAQGAAQGAAQTARSAGGQAVQEARPHLLHALHQLNGELQKMIARMDEAPGAGAPRTSAPSASAPSASAQAPAAPTVTPAAAAATPPAAPPPAAPPPAAPPPAAPQASPAAPEMPEAPEAPPEKKWYEQ